MIFQDEQSQHKGIDDNRRRKSTRIACTLLSMSKQWAKGNAEERNPVIFERELSSRSKRQGNKFIVQMWRIKREITPRGFIVDFADDRKIHEAR